MRRASAFAAVLLVLFWSGGVLSAAEDGAPDAAVAIDASEAEGGGPAVVEEPVEDVTSEGVATDKPEAVDSVSTSEEFSAGPRGSVPVPVMAAAEATPIPSALALGMGSPTAYGGLEASPSVEEPLSGLELGGFMLLGGGLVVTAAGGVVWSEDMGQIGGIALASGAALTAAGAALFFSHTMTDGSEHGGSSIEEQPAAEIVPTVGTLDDGLLLGMFGRF